MAKSDPAEHPRMGGPDTVAPMREDGTEVDENPYNHPDAFTPTPTPRYRFIAGLLIFTGAIIVTLGWYSTGEQRFQMTVGTIAMFGGLLMLYLSKGRFVSARITDQVYQTMAENQAALVDAVGHTDIPVYIPASDTAILYVPHGRSDSIPKPESLTAPRVSTDAGMGLTFVPTGAPLFKDFEGSVVGSIASDPEILATQLEEGLVETFELVRSTEVQSNSDKGRIDFDIKGSVFPEGFDTPTASFLAVGMAHGLNTTIVTEISPDKDNNYTVTCYWNPDSVETAE